VQDVVVYEVGPRDGLQNEPDTVATPAKLELVTRLATSGLRRIEITSFVSPAWIPQLADADDLAATVPEVPGVVYSALVPNERGYDRFIAAGGAKVAALFISASETHNRKNVNASVAESLERMRPVAERAGADGVGLRAYVSTVCGCPYEGEVSVGAVVALTRSLLDLGVVKGTEIRPELVSAAGDPVAYRIRGALIALRREQADWIRIRRQAEPVELAS